MDETNILHKLLQYGSYLVVGVLGWFFRRHAEKTDAKEREQDVKIEVLDKRLNGHDISRADMNAQIISMHRILEKMDKNIDKLLDNK